LRAPRHGSLFLDTVCGIPDARTEIVMLKPPGDGSRLELSSFVRPDSVPGSPAAMANELGLRNVAFEVSDLQAAVDWAATEGYGLVGGIGEYEGAWRMAYVRGPEGIIVSNQMLPFLERAICRWAGAVIDSECPPGPRLSLFPVGTARMRVHGGDCAARAAGRRRSPGRHLRRTRHGQHG
jgi:catechol 2,3-dioxygenase-like lactoylglutathione lyase family enzyme